MVEEVKRLVDAGRARGEPHLPGHHRLRPRPAREDSADKAALADLVAAVADVPGRALGARLLPLPGDARRRARRPPRQPPARGALRRHAAPARGRRHAPADAARPRRRAPPPRGEPAQEPRSPISPSAPRSSSATRARPTPSSTSSARSCSGPSSTGSACSATRTRRACGSFALAGQGAGAGRRAPPPPADGLAAPHRPRQERARSSGASWRCWSRARATSTSTCSWGATRGRRRTSTGRCTCPAARRVRARSAASVVTQASDYDLVGELLDAGADGRPQTRPAEGRPRPRPAEAPGRPPGPANRRALTANRVGDGRGRSAW